MFVIETIIKDQKKSVLVVIPMTKDILKLNIISFTKDVLQMSRLTNGVIDKASIKGLPSES